ncbi:unnamed protein product [Gordionus sp. m RMFG-2023]
MEAALPPKLGGIGIQSRISLCISAFLSSVAKFRFTQGYYRPTPCDSTRPLEKNVPNRSYPISKRQRYWILPLMQHCVEYLHFKSKKIPVILFPLKPSPNNNNTSLLPDQIISASPICHLGYEWL